MSIIDQKEGSTAKPKFNTALEAMRGLAAVLVVFHHILSPEYPIDPVYHPHGIWQYAAPGHLSVIIFFVLSGYVIRQRYTKPLINWIEWREYLRKRFDRLYPIFLVAVLLSLVVSVCAGVNRSPKSIILTLLFGSGVFTPVWGTNLPAWSLTYEVLFYIAFLGVSALRLNQTWTMVGCFALGFLNTKLGFMPLIVSCFLFGGGIWLMGTVLAQLPKKEAPSSAGKMLALLLLLLCWERMNLFNSIFTALNLDVTIQEAPDFYDRIIVFSNISLLVFTVPLMLRFTNKVLPFGVWLERLAFATPGVYLAAYVISGKIQERALFNTLFLAVVFYGISLVVYIFSWKFEQLGKKVVALLVPLGSISYALYICHFPILFLFRLVPSFQGTIVTFWLRTILYLLIVGIISYYLERSFQPWVKRLLNR